VDLAEFQTAIDARRCAKEWQDALPIARSGASAFIKV
jgi:hypothetical protein